MTNIMEGTEYSYDLNDLAIVGKNPKGIVFSYKQGAKIQIDITDSDDRERQYKVILQSWKDYNSTK